MCKRNDPNAAKDLFEPIEPYIVADGFDLDHWCEKMFRRIEVRNVVVWVSYRFPEEDDDDVSALVETPYGDKYWAYFCTPAALARGLEIETSEYGNPAYHCRRGTIVVREVTEAKLVAVVADLISRKVLTRALSPVDDESC